MKATTFKVKDKGAPGRTPKSKRWFRPSLHTGWDKNLPQETRVAKVVKAHKGNLLSAARSLRALANVTVDPETHRKATADARVLFKRYDGEK